jgi:hypothetical protein
VETGPGVLVFPVGCGPEAYESDPLAAPTPTLKQKPGTSLSIKADDFSLPPMKVSSLLTARPANARSQVFKPAVACMVLTVLCGFIPRFGMVLATVFGLVALGLTIGTLARGDRRGLPLLLAYLVLVPLACGVALALQATLSGSAPSALKVQSDRAFLEASPPRPTATPAEPIGVTAPTSAARPVSTPDATAPAADRLGPFLQAFVRSWGSESGLSEVDFYAERARYDGKERSRSAIAQEAAAYNARWPKRRFWLLCPSTVEPGDGPVRRVRLRAGFAVENDARRVTGGSHLPARSGTSWGGL